MATRTDYEGMTVDELRTKARREGISGVSRMKKAELVDALAGGAGQGGRDRAEVDSGSGGSGGLARSRSGGGRTRASKGRQTSKSLKYSQEITSADEHEERPGRSLYTRDHEAIRRWAEERDAAPATIDGTEHDDHLGVLRFDFGGDSRNDRLRHVDWDEWFRTFDDRNLNFIYQEHRSDGNPSTFFRLENPDREDA